MLSHKQGFEQQTQGLPGAMQSRLYGSRGDSQMLGRLFGVEFLDVAKQEDPAIRIRQPVDACPDVSAYLGLSKLRQSLVTPGPHRAAVVAGLVESGEQVVDGDLRPPSLGP